MKLLESDLPVWGLIQGYVSRPCGLISALKFEDILKMSHSFLDLEDGTSIGPMTHDNAQKLSNHMYANKTLAVIPNFGLQAIYIDTNSLLYQLASKEIRYFLPGMTFFPEDGLTLIGFGKFFSDFVLDNSIASCAPATAFPVGKPWAKPIRERRGENLRHDLAWNPPDITLLEDLSLFVDYIKTLAYSITPEADKKFRANEKIRWDQIHEKIKLSMKEEDGYREKHGIPLSEIYEMHDPFLTTRCYKP
jgi:hypothetical protein